MIDISIIIVNYNVKEYLKNLVHSIEKASQGINLEIIVVDNASTDGSVEEISSKLPHVKLIVNDTNLGFGKANNIGLQQAGGKYLLLLNPDTIVRENTFTALIEFFEKNEDAGLLGCKVLNPDGSLQLPCRRSFPTPWVSFTKITGLSTLFPKSKLFAKYNLTYLDENKVNEVDAISGAFMFMRREVYDKIGGFDPQFFMYGEDLDLCYRTQHAGFKVYYVPHTEIIHYKGESTRRSNLDETKVFYDAMRLFVKKHFSASFVLEWLLRFAIIVRRTFAFINIYRLPIVSVIIDTAIYIAVINLGEIIYAHGSWRGFPEDVKPWVYLTPAIFQLIISLSSAAYKKNMISVLRIMISLFFGFVFLSSLSYFFKQFGYSRAVFLISYGILGIILPLWRIIAKLVFNIGESNFRNNNYTLVVGDIQNISGLVDRLKNTVTGIYSIRGLIGINQKYIGDKVGNYSYIGSIENMKKVLISQKINTVIFNSSDVSYDKIFSVVSDCQGLNVQFLVSGSNQDYLVGKSEITSLEEIPFMRLYYNISSSGHRIIKAFFDIILSLFILLLIYPFVYFFSKVSGKKTKFAQLILDVPSVLVLKKSFVGPRDESYYEDLYLGRKGLTGLWNLENIPVQDKDEMKKINLYYAKNQNVWLDIDIIGRTLGKYLLRREK